MKSKVTFNKSGSGSVSGRVTIPKEFLEIMKITKEDNNINITYEDNKIILEKLNQVKNGLVENIS